MTVKAKIVSSFGILVALIIALVTINSYQNFKSYSGHTTTDSLELEASLTASIVDQKMSRYFDGLRLMSDEIAIDDTGAMLDEREIRSQLLKLEKNLNMFGAAFGQTDGTTYNSNGIIANFNAKDLGREWYKNAMADKRNAATVPYVNNVGDLVMSLSVPIKRNGDIVGILNANISVDTISKQVTKRSQKNQIYISRADGYLLAASDPELIGQDLYKLRPSFTTYKTQSGKGHTYELDGDEYYIINEKLDEMGWMVWSWEPVKEIEAAANSNLLQASLMAIVLIALALIMTYAIVIKLMYLPIGGEPSDIQKLVVQVAEGDLSLAGTETGQETGILASLFVMAARLKSSIERIDQATKELTVSAEQTSVSAEEVNLSSEKQMIQIEQTSTAMNEMNVTVQEVANNAVQASSAAQEAFTHSTTGMSVVENMNGNITKLVSGIENVVTVNAQLETETMSIGSILEVIDGISEQTNLLALNAAIEAARAGEHGRGFAVVADEVRNLANRTKESTSEIQEMINKLQTQAKNSVELMSVNVQDAEATSDKSLAASQALEAIRSSVTMIEDMNSQIATAAEQQTHVASGINESIVEINNSAKVTYDRSEGNKERAKTLSDIAASLKESINVFRY